MLPKKDVKPFARRYANGRTKIDDASQKRIIATQRPKPLCTHTKMDILRGSYSCDLCGRPSPLQWLYVCSQDNQIDHRQSSQPLDQSVSVADDGMDSVERELSYLGISASVISQYKAGLYTADQIEIIQDQKRHLLDTIARSNGVSRSSSRKVPTSRRSRDNKAAKHSMGVPHRDDQQSVSSLLTQLVADLDGSSPSQPNSTPRTESQMQICSFKCCHHCRRYCIDRLPLSLAAVARGQVPPLSLQDAYSLPITNANVVKSIDIQRDSHLSHPDTTSTGGNTTTTSGSATPLSPSSTESLEDESTTGHIGEEQYHHELRGSAPRFPPGLPIRTRQLDKAWGDATGDISSSEDDTILSNDTKLQTSSTASSLGYETCATERSLVDSEHQELDLSNVTMRKDSRNDCYASTNGATSREKPCRDSVESSDDLVDAQGGVALHGEDAEKHTIDVITQG